MSETTAAAKGFVSGITSKAWNYQCFESRETERKAIITLIAITAICLLIAILCKSGGLGTISGITGLIALALTARRILKNREIEKVDESVSITWSEVKHALFDKDVNEIKAPANLIKVLGDKKAIKTDEFQKISPPSKQNDAIMQIISSKVDTLPTITYGTFNDGQVFIIIKLLQSKPKESHVFYANFLLFTGPKEEGKPWEAFDTTITDSKWDLLFDMRTDDLAALEKIVKDNKGTLRGRNHPWEISLPR